MRFWLLDKITSYEPGVSLTAVKNVTLSEDYLQDHFPEFPVLPGVFILEAATQAAAWLLRLTEDYSHSIILLQDAKNIKYADFVSPGNQLQISVKLIKQDDRLATFKVTGMVEERTTLNGRIVLERFNLAESDPTEAEHDQQIIQKYKQMQNLILKGDVAVS